MKFVLDRRSQDVDKDAVCSFRAGESKLDQLNLLRSTFFCVILMFKFEGIFKGFVKSGNYKLNCN